MKGETGPGRPWPAERSGVHSEPCRRCIRYRTRSTAPPGERGARSARGSHLPSEVDHPTGRARSSLSQGRPPAEAAGLRARSRPTGRARSSLSQGGLEPRPQAFESGAAEPSESQLQERLWAVVQIAARSRFARCAGGCRGLPRAARARRGLGRPSARSPAAERCRAPLLSRGGARGCSRDGPSLAAEGRCSSHAEGCLVSGERGRQARFGAHANCRQPSLATL